MSFLHGDKTGLVVCWDWNWMIRRTATSYYFHIKNGPSVWSFFVFSDFFLSLLQLGNYGHNWICACRCPCNGKGHCKLLSWWLANWQSYTIALYGIYCTGTLSPNHLSPLLSFSRTLLLSRHVWMCCQKSLSQKSATCLVRCSSMWSLCSSTQW